MKIEIVTSGLKEAERAFQEIDANWQREIERDLDVAGQPIELALQEYPPPIPTSDYVRTFTYQRGIDVHTAIMGNVVQFEALQLADYSVYLRGNLDGYEGARVHRNRWRSLANIVETYIPVVVSRLESRIESWLKLIFGG